MTRILLTLMIVAGGLCLQPVAADDPTRPMSEAEIRAWLQGGPDGAASADLDLQSILISDARRLAIIDGQRVAVGDRIATARVVAIEAGRVRLERAGETLILELDSSYRIDH